MRSYSLVVGLLLVSFGAGPVSAQKRLICLVPQSGSMKDIVSVATNGTNPQTLHTVTGSANLLVDSIARKLWFRDGTTLYSSNLDGSDRQTFASPAVCIGSLEDPALSEDGTKIHGKGSTCSPNGGGGSGTFLFNWPFAGVIGQYRGNETVPGSGLVYSLTDLCELVAMDHGGASLNILAELIPNAICGSPLALNSANQKLYFQVFDSGQWLARTNLDGSGTELVSLFPSAIDMVIDGDAGKVYWTGFGAGNTTLGLFSTNMDGSGETLLVAGATHVELADLTEPEVVPTVSEWGIVVMVLLTMTSATVLVRSRSFATT